MLYWYRDLMISDKLKDKPQKHIDRIESYYNALPKSKIFSDRKRVWERFVGKKIPWREYYVITRAYNSEDLFDVIGVRQWVLRHYSRIDIYVIGLFTTPFEALDAMRELITEEYAKDPDFQPRSLFSVDGEFQKNSERKTTEAAGKSTKKKDRKSAKKSKKKPD